MKNVRTTAHLASRVHDDQLITTVLLLGFCFERATARSPVVTSTARCECASRAIMCARNDGALEWNNRIVARLAGAASLYTSITQLVCGLILQ